MAYIARAGIISWATPRVMVHQEREASDIAMDAIPNSGVIKKIELDAHAENIVRRILVAKSASAVLRPVWREIRRVDSRVWFILQSASAVHFDLCIKVGFNSSGGNLLGCMHSTVVSID